MNRSIVNHFMKNKTLPFLFAVFGLLTCCSQTQAQEVLHLKHKPAGVFALGVRMNEAMVEFPDDHSTSLGVGGQMRLQFSNRLNSEWFLDFSRSDVMPGITRTDYYFGSDLMIYLRKNLRRIQPYAVVGPGIAAYRINSVTNGNNSASVFLPAAQAGLATHFNVTYRFDLSLTAQYIMEYGHDLETTLNGDEVTISRSTEKKFEGHPQLTLSMNFKIADLW